MKRGKFLVRSLFTFRASLLATCGSHFAARCSLFASCGLLFVLCGPQRSGEDRSISRASQVITEGHTADIQRAALLPAAPVFARPSAREAPIRWPIELTGTPVSSCLSASCFLPLPTYSFIPAEALHALWPLRLQGRLPFSVFRFPPSNLLHTLPRTARSFTVDKLQQVYLVDEQNAVYKYSPDGKELFYYNNNTRGELGYIDVTDPFNLLLFYPELQVIATLDRTLNESGVLRLFSAGVVNATAIGLATDNNIWVYDQANFQLRKVGQDGQVLLASDNLSAQLIQAPQATQLTAQQNKLYLNCPEQGVFVFDNFGQFHQLLPYKHVREIQLLDSKVLLYQAERVRVYDLKTLQEHTLRDAIPTDSILQVRYQGNRYYQLTDEGKVAVYQRD